MFDAHLEYENLASIKEDFLVFKNELIEQNPDLDPSEDNLIISIDNLLQEISAVKGKNDFSPSKRVKIMALLNYVGHLMEFEESLGEDEMDADELAEFFNALGDFNEELDDELLFDDEEIVLVDHKKADKKSKALPISSTEKKKAPAKKNPPAPKKKSGKK